MPSAALAFPPPLREGDRLSSEEFLHRWSAMPELRHAELIGGVVFLIASPVYLPHGTLQTSIGAWLWLYQQSTPGCQAGSDTTWRMTASDVPQPDVFLRILPAFGGQSRDDGYLATGAPELAVEVSGSTTSRDLGIKLELYRSQGVREYLSIVLYPKQVLWRRLVRGNYQDIEPGEDGLIRSRVFPGLWLDPAAIWDPRKSLRAALELGLQSPEHAAFARKLAAKRRKLVPAKAGP